MLLTFEPYLQPKLVLEKKLLPHWEHLEMPAETLVGSIVPKLTLKGLKPVVLILTTTSGH